MSQPPPEEQPAPEAAAPEPAFGEPVAAVLARMAARLLDGALMVLAVLVSVPLGTGGRLAVLVVVPILYETVMVTIAGRTAGKMLLGLHVVRRADGLRPGWPAALARAAPSGILAAGPVVAAVVVVVCILPVVGDQRLGRSVQDRLARTVVVQRQRPWAPAAPPPPAH